MVRRLIGGIWIIFAKLGGGVQIFFGFHPLFGKLIHFLRFFFFQMGWFNKEFGSVTGSFPLWSRFFSIFP